MGAGDTAGSCICLLKSQRFLFYIRFFGQYGIIDHFFQLLSVITEGKRYINKISITMQIDAKALICVMLRLTTKKGHL